MARRTHLGPAPLLAAAISVIALLVLAACGSSASGTTGGNTPASSPSVATTTPVKGNAVTISNFTFTPANLTVAVGTKVTWTNQDSAPHTVTSTDGPSLGAGVTKTFDSGDLGQGGTFSFTFDKAGTYYYECTIHATMASMHAVVVAK